MKKLAEVVHQAQSIILSTHRQCDGDGLGAQLGLYHALKSSGKKVSVINVDATPKKYKFLNPDSHIQYFDSNPNFSEVDLTLIFDTNDERSVEPLFPVLKAKSKKILFIDHHPLLIKGPRPTIESYIDVTAASTGELAYRLIKELKLPINKDVATCLYTSITFDTQLYRFVRNSANSHLIAAEMIQHKIDVEEVHRSLFGNQTVHKMEFLATVIGQIEYFCDGKLAILKLKDSDLLRHHLEPDESRDVIDMLMNIETIEAAALFREDNVNEYKLSLRSKGKIEVLSLAENFGGGGHTFASGASLRGAYSEYRDSVVKHLSQLLMAKASAS